MTGKLAAKSDREHPCKDVFRTHQIPLWSIAQRMGVSYPYLSHILNGNIDPTQEQDEKIREYAKTVLDSYETKTNKN